MLKRCLSPLTLVNQVALIVLLSTAIGLAGMAVSGWCKAFRAAPMRSTKRERCACKVTVCWQQCH